MANFFADLISANGLEDITYAEPYAGGAGAGISLLTEGHVSSILINDACPAVYSFWFYLVNNSEAFLELFETTPVTLDEWKLQRAIFKRTTNPCLELGFATFFLSRCNRSGILWAGPIGGQTMCKQRLAKDKIDCRYKKDKLREKLLNIVSLREHITASNLDASAFLRELNHRSDNLLVYLDPPYYVRGATLYLNHYEHEDHADLSKFLRDEARFSWVLSYDNVKATRELYLSCPLYQFDLRYTAAKMRIGSELLTHSNDVRLPKPPVIRRWKSDIPLRRIK